ncbi:thiamine-phosphate pyrophosphorylase, putative [hydrothermal vent metagenome]|uniref:Thiamine-phosphate pyrophosphorylase, putative n=1 Tax=hydrothermal vent metagenome TaxID=652676 RepID=A0A3B0R9P9_9ZZZZ
MTDKEQPQIYLITPPAPDLNWYATTLPAVLDANEVACIRLSLASADEDQIARAADACREVAHTHDVALVIDSHLMLVDRLGLDGVHLTDGARSVRAARKELGPDPIIGAFCGTSRHEGVNAGEAGADYVSFGPVGQSALGDGTCASANLFAWWTEMIELPVVAEGQLDTNLIRTLAPITDFFGIGNEIWNSNNPATTLADMIAVFN